MSEDEIRVQQPAEHNRHPTLADLERVAPGFTGIRRETPALIDWDALHASLGATLPSDYREFCDRYPPAVIKQDLLIDVPPPGEENGYRERMIARVERGQHMAEIDEMTAFTFYPAPGGRGDRRSNARQPLSTGRSAPAARQQGCHLDP